MPAKASTPPTPHPSTVGNSFVKQYYHLLAQSPQTLHRFYKDDSKFTHGLGSQSEEAISGQKNINDKIMSMGYEGARVDLESGSVDCQTSLDGGVMVMVAGVITLKDKPPRAFVQTFFLAVQPKGYFVLNDAFRYLDTLAPARASAPPSPKKAPVSPPLPPTPPPEPTPVPAPVQPASSPKKTPVSSPKKPATPKAKEEAAPSAWAREQAKPTTPTSPKPPVSKPSKPAPAAEKTPAPPVEKPVQTQKGSKGQAPAAAASKPAPSPQSSAPKSWASHLFSGAKPQAVASSAGASVTVPKTEAAGSPRGDNNVKERAIRLGVLHIREIPSNTKENDLRDLFQSFGNITAITIVPSKCYAFVDFDSHDAVISVMSKGPYKLFDSPIIVEERAERKDGGGRGGFRRDNRGGRGGRGGAGRGGRERGRRGGRVDGRGQRSD